ncbi:hypothetical protein [Sediminitomix flava]|uniref:DinB family protein n=1 Tax=Sediminitomix flava TaxID=379075 RepID=A0A315ZCY2_SEDFL|nr:hypothetical protein [Sediminitomix flava]PWJ42969.1 hypothetical protein BC781_102516 [Sediminitomix flava]
MLKKITTNLLNQLQSAISNLDEQTYSQEIDILGNSSIGQHCRHILSFYECLIDAKHSGFVNYDQRKRLLKIENSPVVANMFIETLKEKLEKVEFSNPITLEGQYGNTSDLNCFKVKSSLERELIANIEHSVHHMAIVRIALRYLKPNFKLDDSFGIASSTIRYQDSQQSEQ